MQDNLKTAQTESSKPAPPVRTLGALLAPSLHFHLHIKSLSKVVFFHFHFCNTARLRSFLMDKDAQTPVHAFIMSRIEYCSSVLTGLQSPLAYIQNSQLTHPYQALILSPYTGFRIKFRLVLFLTFKALRKLAALYLCELLTSYSASHSLFSCSNLLVVPRTRLSTP